MMAYIAAAENGMTILKMWPDKTSPHAVEMTKNVKDCFFLAEKIKAKRDVDPAFVMKKVYLSQFNQAEQFYIEKCNTIRGHVFELWEPRFGIINIFEPKQFNDPDGLLPLSLKQMRNHKSWSRPIDVADPKHFINGKPDIATEINGFEVMQKQVSDCSVLCSLAVCAHFEFKHKYTTKLISQNIYPQDTFGTPIYNPAGKYVVKLFINGSFRAVTIDDYFPMGQYGTW